MTRLPIHLSSKLQMLLRASVMAISFTLKAWFFVITFISFTIFCCKSDEVEADPAQVVPKALLCFNDKMIYSSCEETYRLTESGNINVPSEATDQYCNGPCLTETHLVLNCIDNILSNFLFYNKATIQDIRDTLSLGCGYSNGRGNFNVAEHIQGETYSHAQRIADPIYLYVYALIIVGCVLLL